MNIMLVQKRKILKKQYKDVLGFLTYFPFLYSEEKMIKNIIKNLMNVKSFKDLCVNLKTNYNFHSKEFDKFQEILWEYQNYDEIIFSGILNEKEIFKILEDKERHFYFYDFSQEEIEVLFSIYLHTINNNKIYLPDKIKEGFKFFFPKIVSFFNLDFNLDLINENAFYALKKKIKNKMLKELNVINENDIC